MPKDKTVVTVISKITDLPVDRSAALVVIYGVELGRKYDLTREITSIGRSSKSNIQIDQESVSRNHARLMNKEGSATVEDLGSTNGTWLNDSMLRGGMALRNGDMIKIGRTVFKYIAGNNVEAM